MKDRKHRDDATLWNDFLDGDTEAYSMIFDRYIMVMFMYGSQFCGDRDMVKDCIQDVFVTMYSGRRRLGPTDNIKYYLFGALRNSIINAIKKDQRRNNLHQTFFKSGHTPEGRHADRLELEEDELLMNARLSRMMDRLSPRQRQIVYYRYIDNLSVTEISDLLGISYQAVLNTIQRAIKKIRTNNLN